MIQHPDGLSGCWIRPVNPLSLLNTCEIYDAGSVCNNPNLGITNINIVGFIVMKTVMLEHLDWESAELI